MGKKIDVFVLSVMAAIALYLYFYRAFENHAAAILLSGICFVILTKMIRKTMHLLGKSRWLQRQHMRRLSGSTLMSLACADAEEAKARISSLLQKCYGADFVLEMVQLPPSATLPQQRLFELWKQHRQEERLVICATCNCSADCRTLSDSLKQPKIALLDANALMGLIAEHPEGIFVKDAPVKRRRLHLKRLASLLINRRNAPRCLLFSAIMLLMYLISAQYSYLIAAMLLLFVALAAFKKVRRPAKLF